MHFTPSSSILCARLPALFTQLLFVGWEGRWSPNWKIIPNLLQFVSRGMSPLFPPLITKTTSDAGFQVGSWERKTSMTVLSGSCLGLPVSSLILSNYNMSSYLFTCWRQCKPVLNLPYQYCDEFKLLIACKALRESRNITTEWFPRFLVILTAVKWLVTLQWRLRVQKKDFLLLTAEKPSPFLNFEPSVYTSCDHWNDARGIPVSALIFPIPKGKIYRIKWDN